MRALLRTLAPFAVAAALLAAAFAFVFYTNYRSRKGRELARNPRATLLFYWGELAHQVRIEGRVEKMMARESDSSVSLAMGTTLWMPIGLFALIAAPIITDPATIRALAWAFL